MGKISLKGQFVFSGVGEFSSTIRKIKILKQIGRDLFVCGDRPEPELVYSVPIDKVLTYAHIDNQGDSLDNWLVSVILKPAGFIPDPLIDYNQQQSIVGDEEFVTVDKEGIKDSYLLHTPVQNWADHKVHTGNGNIHQLINYSDETISYSYGGSQVFETETRRSSNINLGGGGISNLTGALRQVTGSDSTAAERVIYKFPYHKIKGVFNSFRQEFDSNNFSYNFQMISAQDWILRESDKDYKKEIIEEPRRRSDGGGNKGGAAMKRYIEKGAEPGDYAVVVRVSPGYFGSWPYPCQHTGVPFGTYTAICSARAPYPNERTYCPKSYGYYYDNKRVINRTFDFSPPNAIAEENNITGKIEAIFIPSIASLNTGKMTEPGDTLTSVIARARIVRYLVYQNYLNFS